METIIFDGKEIESKIQKLKSEEKSDIEIAQELIAEGYTLDSFRYNKIRYNWFKQHLMF